MAVSTLKCLQQLCTSYYSTSPTSAGSLKLLMNTQEHLYSCWTFTVLSGQVIGWDPSQKVGKPPQKHNFSLQQAKSHQHSASMTIQHWMTPPVFVRNCKRLQMKLKCSFSWEGKTEQSPEMWWQTITVCPSLHVIRLLFSSGSPSFQCTDFFFAAKYHAAPLQSLETASPFHPRGFTV